jgi:activator of HSP90 ATPase
MAKWGEGDPRWIVEQRGDAHNVNNWHWREADATDWSKDFLKDILCNISIEDKNSKLKFTAVHAIDGEASCCVRKAKFICIFDWELITLKWTGNVAGVETDFKGTLTIEGFDHDCEDQDELILTGKFEKSGPPEHPALKNLVKNSGQRIWEAFEIYKQTLKESFANKLSFNKDTSKEEVNNNKNPVAEKTKTAIKLDTVKSSLPKATSPSKPTPVTGAKISTKRITMSEMFIGSVEDLYQCLTSIERLMIWTHGSLKLEGSSKQKDLVKDDRVELFNGTVQASIGNLERDSKLNMQWRLKEWPSGHYSTVEISLTQTSAGAKLSLDQKQVPSEHVAKTQESWKRFYFGEIKRMFGMGRLDGM